MKIVVLNIVFLFTILFVSCSSIAWHGLGGALIENCDDIITKSFDDIENYWIYRTKTSAFNMSLIKYDYKNKKEFFLSLTSYAQSLVVDGKGLILVFEDDTQLRIDCDVKVEVNESYSSDYNSVFAIGVNWLTDQQIKNKYKYYIFIYLTDDNLKLLSTKDIKKWRLYIFDGQPMSEIFAKNFKSAVNCLLLP